MRYKNWLVVAILLFLAGMMLGLSTPDSFVSLLAKDIAALQDLSRTLAALPPLTTAILIFAKNASALLASFAFSPLLLLFPILALTTKGWLLAWVSATILQKNSVLLLLAGILPHGIIEIPAFVIGEAAALSFGAAVIAALITGNRSSLMPNLKRSVKYLALAAVLLVPAAIIETYVTPLLVR